MDTVPPEVLAAVRSDDDAAFEALDSNRDVCFLVDWREEDDAIVRYCEHILQTGQLSAQWADAELFITFGSKRLAVPLTESPADRHITLLTLNEALHPQFEVRMLYASVGRDGGTFLPLSSAAWRALEQEAPEVISRRFHKLTPHPNTFTEVVKVPRKPGTRPWWQFWSRR